MRHLLTHTAGVRAVRGAGDLLRPALGWAAPVGRAPALADYSRGGLRIDVAPGTRSAYSNHGFAALGQIVEDIAGVPFDRYLRERVLGGGANAHGAVLAPASVAAMFAPHHQPDPRLGGMGLAFFRGEAGGHRSVGHDGIWTGFRSDMVLAPDAGVGVLALANTGWFDPRGATGPVADAVLRAVLGVPADVIRTDVPERPETWRRLCGRYAFGPGVLTDPQPRMLLGPGVEVVVRRNHLAIRGEMPIPAVRRVLRLHPEADDPYAFRVDLSSIGPGTTRVVFSRGTVGDVTALHVGLAGMSLRKRSPGRATR